MRYLISVSAARLRDHPEFARLTVWGKDALGRNDGEAIYIGKGGRGSNSRFYFFSPENELRELVEKLTSDSPETEVEIQSVTPRNLPRNLRNFYRELAVILHAGRL